MGGRWLLSYGPVQQTEYTGFPARPGLQTPPPLLQACFSPDERLVVTGTSARKADAPGAVMFFDMRELKLVQRLGVSGSVIALQARVAGIAAGREGGPGRGLGIQGRGVWSQRGPARVMLSMAGAASTRDVGSSS